MMNPNAMPQRGRAANERGAALLVSLVVLLVLTILGVTAAQTTTLQERMAGNMRDKSIAFQAAEATLRFGEGWIQQKVEEGDRPSPVAKSKCSAAPCDVYENDTFTDPEKDATWSSNTSFMRPDGASDGPDLEQTATQPQYFIEQQQFVPDSLNTGGGQRKGRTYYRITARAEGTTESGVSVLSSTYAARF